MSKNLENFLNPATSNEQGLLINLSGTNSSCKKYKSGGIFTSSKQSLNEKYWVYNSQQTYDIT